MSLQSTDAAFSTALSAALALPPMSHNCRPAMFRETSGSWLVCLARNGEARPAYWLKVRKPVRSIPPSRRKEEQLSAALEYRIALAISDHFSQFSEFRDSVPRPVKFLPDHQTILMEYGGSRLLKDMLIWRGNVLGSLRSRRELLRVAELCGAWISLLHIMDHPDWLPVHRIDADELRSRTVTAAARLPEAVRRQVPLDTLLGWVSEMTTGSQHLAVSHGDYQPGNILVAGSQIGVIDMATAGIRPVEDDLGTFITFLFTQKQRVVFSSIAGSRGLTRQLRDAFLNGCGFRSREDLDRLRPFMAWHIVQRLADMSTRIDRWPRLVRPLLRRRLADWVRSELPLVIEG